MNMSTKEEQEMKIIAKCWSDEGFKQKLLSDPAATLKAEGVALPDGLSVKALENTDKVFHLVIPAKPEGLSDVLSDEDLDMVAGGRRQDRSDEGDGRTYSQLVAERDYRQRNRLGHRAWRGLKMAGLWITGDVRGWAKMADKDYGPIE